MVLVIRFDVAPCDPFESLLLGLIFCWLAITSGDLLASVVAHAGYDAIALMYIRHRGA